MAQWTHIIGCIRIDGLPGVVESHTVENVKKIFGPMCLFDDWNEKSTLPLGSEGGLQYQVIEYYHGIPWVVIPIWGDLRNFGPEDILIITDWCEQILAKLEKESFIIRDAILQSEPEGFPQTILTKDGEFPCAQD